MKDGRLFSKLTGSGFLRFSVLGAAVLLFTLILTYVLTEVLHLYYLYSYIVVLLTATVLNYLLATKIIFRTKEKRRMRFFYYILSLIVFYLADIILTRFLTESLMVWYMASILISRVIFFLLKFIYYKKFLFNDRSFFYRVQ